MIHTVTITLTRTGDRLVLPMRPPTLDGYVIRSITGIGPSEATVSALDYAFRPGSHVGNTRVQNREIVLTLVIPGGDAEARRHRLYEMFPPGEKIGLRFDTDLRAVTIQGYVKRTEPDIFAEETSVVVTVLCNDPHFTGVGPDANLVVDGSGWRGGFEFPFSDPIIFGSPSGDTPTDMTVVYSGDAPSDYKITINLTGSPGGWTYIVFEPGGTMQLGGAFWWNGQLSPFQAGDVIEILNNSEGKFIYVTRSNTRVSGIMSLHYQSVWPVLNLGTTNVKLITTNPNAGTLRIEYAKRYRGV